MDRIAELFARLAELTADERAELRTLIAEAAAEVAGQPRTAETVATLGELATQLEGLDAREVEVAAEQAALDEAAEAALARLTPPDPEPTAEEAAAEAEAVAEAERVAAEAAAAGAEPAAATAAATPPVRPSLAAAAARRSAAAAAPPARETEERHGATLVASADVPNVGPGTEFETARALAEAFERRRGEIGTSKGGDGNKVPVAHARFDYPEERRLTRDADVNTQRINAVVDAALRPEALVAAGGLCAPLENIYDVEVVGVTDRPVRDSLPGFNATRGGVSLRPSPIFQDLNGASGIWTMANDVAPSAPATKAIMEVLCQAFEQFTVDAVTMRLLFHNIASKFDPEGTQANIQAAMVAHARLAENELLAKMMALSKILTAPATVSAARDLLAVFDHVIAYYKWRHRVGDQTRLHAWIPRWVKDMIRLDLARGPAYAGPENLAVADSVITDFFAARNVTVTWHLDGRVVDSADLDPGAGTIVAPLQGWADVANLGAVPGFPAKVELLIATEGDFLFLDGGELDLGLVRDSTLNAINEYQTFTETFEGVASRGLESVRVIATVEPNGTSSAPKDLSALSD